MAVDPAVAQSARKRIAWRILPFLFLLYIIAFLDRMNVGAAALQMPATWVSTTAWWVSGPECSSSDTWCWKFPAH